MGTGTAFDTFSAKEHKDLFYDVVTVPTALQTAFSRVFPMRLEWWTSNLGNTVRLEVRR